MGCLKNVTRSIFLTVVVVGFVAFGGQDWIKKSIDNFLHPTHDVILERAQKVGDFSKVNKEFEIEKAAGIMGYNADDQGAFIPARKSPETIPVSERFFFRTENGAGFGFRRSLSIRAEMGGIILCRIRIKPV